MAVGALSALRRSGVRVPDEVGVVGFDDIPIAAYVSPPLTSVQVPIADLGRRALEVLLGEVLSRGGQQSVQEVLPTQLVIRRSCGAGVDAGVGGDAAVPTGSG
jgi:LacI family transcriptional regulator